MFLCFTLFNNHVLCRMDAKYPGKIPTGDSDDDRDNVSSGTSASSLPEEKTGTSDRNVFGANPTAALEPTPER